MLAALAIGGLVGLLVQVIVAGLIFWLLWWLVGFINPPEPFRKILQVVLAIVAVLFLINLLLGLAGHALFTF